MKKLIVIIACVFGSINGFAATITSTASGGEWKTGSSWIGGTPPAPGDNVIIQSTATVTITNNGTTDNSIGSITGSVNFNITVNGTMSLVYSGGPTGGSYMYLDGASTVSIPLGGKITSSSNNTVFGIPVDINSLTIGNIFTGYFPLVLGPTVNGPALISSGGVLPVELISFTTTLSGDNVQISWATASETNNDFFTLERSSDGQNWEIIGEVSGAGTTNIRQAYTYTDLNPIPGMSYYRLKQTDYDGRFEYFTPSVIRYEPDNLLKVFPNPTTDELQITTSSNISQATVSIKNMNGQVKSCPMMVANHRAYITVSHLPAGVYLLELAFPESTISQRIIKN